MKNILLLIPIVLFSTLTALAQGCVNFSTRVTGSIVAHVYGYVPGEGPKSGNTASETPAGAQTYAGAFLTGSGFSADLWAANGAGQAEGALVLVPGSLTSFRTGATLGGTPASRVLQIPGVPTLGTGTFQIRAWDNAGGTLTSYAQAVLAGSPAGKSVLFDVFNLDTCMMGLPSDFVNLRSFNLVLIPEPGSVALLGLGALGLWLFRRKKPAA